MGANFHLGIPLSANSDNQDDFPQKRLMQYDCSEVKNFGAIAPTQTKSL